MRNIVVILEFSVGVAAVVAWIFGVVLAKGTAATWSAVLFAPYAWYLVVEFFARFYWKLP